MKALWSGDISFGLVTIPVKLFSAVREKKVSFHLMSPDGKCRLHHKLVCEETGKEYDYKEAVKGYEESPQEYVLFKQREVADMRPDADPTLQILDFVSSQEVDPRFYNKPYFLSPDKRGVKPYKLLLEAMRRTDKVAIGHFVMRRKRYVVAIKPLEESMELSTLRYDNELLHSKDFPHLRDLSKVSVSSKEIALGTQLIEQMTSKFVPKKYKNEDLEKLARAVASRAKVSLAKNKKGRAAPDEADQEGNVIDLFESLKRSIHGDASKAPSKKRITQNNVHPIKAKKHHRRAAKAG